jgi:hypothetical protein
MVTFSHSAHNPYNSEFAKFHDFMTDSVLPETYAAR